MGCGKTTLGRAVAQLASLPFVDLDEYIEQHEGQSVSDIFARDGEARFRDIELQCLSRLAASSRPAIIACGGGTPCREGAVDLMLRAGTVVWLRADIDRIHARLILEYDKRPLIAAMSPDEILPYIRSALDARSPFYSRASARFDSTLLESPDEIASTARRFIDQFITTDVI